MNTAGLFNLATEEELEKLPKAYLEGHPDKGVKCLMRIPVMKKDSKEYKAIIVTGVLIGELGRDFGLYCISSNNGGKKIFAFIEYKVVKKIVRADIGNKESGFRVQGFKYVFRTRWMVDEDINIIYSQYDDIPDSDITLVAYKCFVRTGILERSSGISDDIPSCCETKDIMAKAVKLYIKERGLTLPVEGMTTNNF